jgi:hypothetical protein
MLVDVVLLVLASPVLLAKGIVRLVQVCLFWRVAYAPSVICSTCNEVVSLVGMWRCSCGYTYQGHVLRVCPICGVWPRMVRCFACGATECLPNL